MQTKLGPAPVAAMVPPKPAASTKPALPTASFSSLQDSRSTDIIILYGRPKEGKTTCALTASKKFDPTKPGKGVVVDDVIVMTFEKTALAQAKALGYEFKYWLDMSPFVDYKLAEFQSILDSALQTCLEAARINPEINTFVFDGVTTLDCIWAAEIQTQEKKEGWDVGRSLNTKHKHLFTRYLLAMPCHVVLTMHSKVAGKNMDAEKKNTLGIDAEDTVVIDLSAWDGPKFYRAQCSMLLPIKRTAGRTPKEDQYFLYPRGVSGMEAGGRYPSVMALDKVPANLQELYKLIAGNPA